MSLTSSHVSGGFVGRRRRYFIDPAVQGALLRQALSYWLWASATFVFIILIYRVVPPWLTGKADETGRIWYHLAPYMVASAVLFPIVVFRAIRFGHRFCGPMVSIRRALKQLAQGDTTPATVRLRRTDYWKDIAEDINAISARLDRTLPTPSADLDAEENDLLPTDGDDTCHEPESDLLHSCAELA